MLLAVDVGNTSVTVGRFHGDELVAVARRPCAEVTGGDLTRLFGLAEVPVEPEDRVALASVNPPVAELILEWAKAHCAAEPLVAEVNLPVRIPDGVAERRRVGVDRLLNGLAAYSRARSACLAVDAGTAITIDAVSAEGVFLGGIIAPGLRMSARALAGGTAFLPQVDLVFPADVLARDTVSAIQSGLLWGAAEMIAGLVTRLTARVGGSARVFLTGGDAPLLSGHLPGAIEVVPYLSLDGLRLAVEGYSTQGGCG
jgi:type III pantothenate kinase